MDFREIGDQLKYLTPNGVGLNIEEKMNVQLALTQLQFELNFEELYFWGKIEGKFSFLHFFIIICYCQLLFKLQIFFI